MIAWLKKKLATWTTPELHQEINRLKKENEETLQLVAEQMDLIRSLNTTIHQIHTIAVNERNELVKILTGMVIQHGGRYILREHSLNAAADDSIQLNSRPADEGVVLEIAPAESRGEADDQ